MWFCARLYCFLFFFLGGDFIYLCICTFNFLYFSTFICDVLATFCGVLFCFAVLCFVCVCVLCVCTTLRNAHSCASVRRVHAEIPYILVFNGEIPTWFWDIGGCMERKKKKKGKENEEAAASRELCSST